MKIINEDIEKQNNKPKRRCFDCIYYPACLKWQGMWLFTEDANKCKLFKEECCTK